MLNKRILVTGASGFVGKELIKLLYKKNYSITACVRTNKSLGNFVIFLEQQSINNVKTLVLPANNSDKTAAHFVKTLNNIDVVIHCAARSHILKELSEQPAEEFKQSNELLTKYLIQAAIINKVKRFIYISSVSIHGNNTDKTPFIETNPPKPESLYAASKLSGERWVKFYSDKIETVIIRPPLIIGPQPKGNLRRLIRAIALGAPLPLANLHNKRQYIGIRNLSLFIINCLESNAAVNKLFLVANNETISTTSLIHEIAHILNKRAYLFSFPQKVLCFILKALGKEKEYYQLAGNLEINTDYAKKILSWQQTYTLREELIYSLANYKI